MDFSLAFALVAAGAVAVNTAPAPCTGDCTVLNLEAGQIKGELHAGNAHFLGVPYARAPIGELRWQPPEAAIPWGAETKTTTKYGSSCMQSSSVYTKFANDSEDCLYLNIWLPKNAGKAKKQYPIMLFFHGGSYETGSAMVPVYGGESAVKLNDDIIIIAANYRLNVFGYLGSDRLRATDGSTGNFGLQDQRAAMVWVKANAAAFWGNPGLLTIYGESAGAGSISNHLVAPKSAGLFDRAIAESGPFSAWISKPLAIAENDFDKVLSETGCGGQKAGPDQTSCLRNLSATDLQAKFHLDCHALLDWAPVIDQVELTAHPRVLAAAGKIHDVPIIFGTNRDEGTLFVDAPANLNATTYEEELTKLYGVALEPQIFKQYPANRWPGTKDGGAEWWTYSHVFGDSCMSCPARQSAGWVVAATGRKSPVFLYFFDHELEVLKTVDWVSKKHAYGVCHASELALVFKVDELLFSVEEKMAQDVVTWWQSFAATGSPGTAPSGQAWPAFTADAGSVLIWNADHDRLNYTVTTALKQADCDFWETRELPNQFTWGQCAFNSTHS